MAVATFRAAHSQWETCRAFVDAARWRWELRHIHFLRSDEGCWNLPLRFPGARSVAPECHC